MTTIFNHRLAGVLLARLSLVRVGCSRSAGVQVAPAAAFCTDYFVRRWQHGSTDAWGAAAHRPIKGVSATVLCLLPGHWHRRPAARFTLYDWTPVCNFSTFVRWLLSRNTVEPVGYSRYAHGYKMLRRGPLGLPVEGPAAARLQEAG